MHEIAALPQKIKELGIKGIRQLILNAYQDPLEIESPWQDMVKDPAFRWNEYNIKQTLAKLTDHPNFMKDGRVIKSLNEDSDLVKYLLSKADFSRADQPKIFKTTLLNVFKILEAARKIKGPEKLKSFFAFFPPPNDEMKCLGGTNSRFNDITRFLQTEDIACKLIGEALNYAGTMAVSTLTYHTSSQNHIHAKTYVDFLVNTKNHRQSLADDDFYQTVESDVTNASKIKIYHDFFEYFRVNLAKNVTNFGEFSKFVSYEQLDKFLQSCIEVTFGDQAKFLDIFSVEFDEVFVPRSGAEEFQHLFALNLVTTCEKLNIKPQDLLEAACERSESETEEGPDEVFYKLNIDKLLDLFREQKYAETQGNLMTTVTTYNQEVYQYPQSHSQGFLDSLKKMIRSENADEVKYAIDMIYCLSMSAPEDNVKMMHDFFISPIAEEYGADSISTLDYLRLIAVSESQFKSLHEDADFVTFYIDKIGPKEDKDFKSGILSRAKIFSDIVTEFEGYLVDFPMLSRLWFHANSTTEEILQAISSEDDFIDLLTQDDQKEVIWKYFSALCSRGDSKIILAAIIAKADEKEKDISEFLNICFCHCCKNHYNDLMNFLKDSEKVDVNFFHELPSGVIYNPLLACCYGGNIEGLQILEEMRCDFKRYEDVDNPIHAAANQGYWAISKALMEKDVSLIHQSKNLIRRAIFDEQSDIAIKMIEKLPLEQAMQDDDPCSEAYAATFKNDIRVIQALARKGYDLNAGFKEYNPMGYAIEHGKTETAKILLENGANINIEHQTINGDPSRLLTLCVTCKNWDLAKMMIDGDRANEESISQVRALISRRRDIKQNIPDDLQQLIDDYGKPVQEEAMPRPEHGASDSHNERPGQDGPPIPTLDLPRDGRRIGGGKGKCHIS